MAESVGWLELEVADSYGLVPEGEHLTVFLPATSKAFVFRVKSRVNRGFERFHYGPLPLPANLPLPSYIGGNIPVPANGVMPATAYTDVGLSFPLSGAFDETDMWYIPKEWGERLFHVKAQITPSWLRVELQIPKGVSQRRFQREKISLGVEKLFGYSRGFIETIHFPNLHYGYRFGNDSNLTVYTGVDFTYGEYIVEIPKDSDLIFNILTRRTASYWLTLPLSVYDAQIKRAFLETYGIEGFTIYPVTERSKAVSEYNALLKEVQV
jgi:hypothetical protein